MKNKGQPDHVQFDFDIRKDTAHGVAQEMVEEFELPNKNIDLIS